MLQAMGANATPMPYGEVYTALKTGLVDGAENNWPSYDTARHFEVAKFYIDHRALDGAGDAADVEEDLRHAAADEQKIFREAAKESVPYMRKLWDEKELKSRKIVEKPRARRWSTGRQEVVQDAMKPVYDKFITDPKLKDNGRKIQASK